tara:strand:+ start:413 stop:847 length:435 start_codon:yes stop_codon:yes gene_type:complete
MLYIFKKLFLISIILLITNCSEKISYSGKILNEKNLQLEDLQNKEQVISKIGKPNYIDPIENKYYYFTEKKNIVNFFNQEIESRNIIVFMFNNNDDIINIYEYDLENEEKISYKDETTSHDIIEKGLLEKIFGGVGKNAPIVQN